MNKKMTLLAGAISSVLSGAALADINNIIISEYVEGSDDNKAIELLNTGDTDFTFDATYTLFRADAKYTNEIQSKTKGHLLDGQTVPAKGTLTIINEDASQALKDAIAANSGAVVEAHGYESGFYNSMTFNGDDTVFIAKKSSYSEVHDLIGLTGEYWGSDKTFVRSIDATTPNSSYDPRAWVEQPKDTFDGLGDSTLLTPPPPPPPPVETTLAEVQGTGMFSPFVEAEFGTPLKEDQFYETEATYKLTAYVGYALPSAGSALSKGFFLYDNDGNPLTSDGLFVYAKDNLPVVGAEVTVVGTVREYYGQTQFNLTEDWVATGSTIPAPAPVELKRIPEDGASFAKTLERHEGMFVKLVEDMDDTKTGNQDMRVTRAFAFDFELYNKRQFRNNLALAYEKPNFHPNQEYVAGSFESIAKIEQNRDATLFLESEKAPSNGNIPYYADFSYDNPIRINDGIKNVEGVIAYTYDEYRLVVKDPAAGGFQMQTSDITPNTPRPESKKNSYGDDTGEYDIVNEEFDGGFTIKVATQNVLNLFNSPYGGSDNQFGDNRGAESEEEYLRQKAKIVKAIYGLDADILGLMEIENNGFGDFGALKELLAAVNANYAEEDYAKRGDQDSIHNRYVFVGFDKNGDTILDENDTVGTDAITSAVIYRPSKVSIVSGKIIQMPEQHAPLVEYPEGGAIVDGDGAVRESGDNYQRNTVAATFKVINTGKRLTVAINHLKSKGSTCHEDWVGWETWDDFDPVNDDVRNDDYQGSCENFRVSAAYQLGTEMAKIGGDQVVLGDMNSYTYEDPMLVLTDNPTKKDIYASSHTFIGDEVFEKNGQKITTTFGYLNAVDLKTPAGKTAWSYSYNNEIGSLDHLLITPSLKDRLVDAADWHINAAESSLNDYSNYKKEPNEIGNPFYAETPIRSSDHDPAMVSLGYKYGESGETNVNIAIKSGRADIAFPVSADAQSGDVAEISISPRPKNVSLPKVTLSDSGAQTVMFDVVGLDTGTYTISMKLTGDRAAAQSAGASAAQVIDSMSMKADITKRDSSNVSPVIPEYDGSGGSFGFGALLSLIGLGFLRRRRQ
ncbi:ExeM/NucH family extracellular endonuclease [Vibrio sp. D404a]|uniref:ExeM/NucH family extracellular endonuclease n=1 Tax=unclassified Vibrio TaxID=2614977 RepID=UPI002555F39F|nr:MULTISPECIES: ExeM/NucH family extracellular endonuclease [unclassified Vibrio]MDK9739914.1 ExeM/NucH family extracellular endonuclease [Vibrio sp. D404a]MDK9799377.1 ExeM/NucH family extracellular endonuclease [Vibrio sp. D449a]